MSDAPHAPLVKINTADEDVPVIIEHPEGYPFTEGEREEWREATDEEYGRYVTYWNDFYAQNGE